MTLQTAACPLLIEQVGHLFQQVHRSAAHAQRSKKDVMMLFTKSPSECINAVCSIVLLVLKQVPRLSADALRRHYAFLADMCKTYRETSKSDELSVAIIHAVMPFHNANEKLVRRAVVMLFEVLLKTVDQANTSDDRQDLYQELAELLKCRIHDKSPAVRESAVAAVAAFQTGKKDCDVTQQLIALLCTDTHADVRRQILRCIAPRKEFLEGYFHGMVRCTRDVVARVRAEAWDALGRFPWRYITAYTVAKRVRLWEVLQHGLTDPNSSVRIACRATLTNCWLHRDCKEDCIALLDAVITGCALMTLEPYDNLCNELLAYCHKRHPEHHFELDLQDIHTAALLLWKADCRLLCDTEGADETVLLLPLEDFTAVLQDTVYAYAKPDAPQRKVKFRSLDDADNMLRVLLSVFDLYEENGYLAHADNTTRGTLLRLFNFLLKVVPDDDPALFVEVAVRSVKALTARTPDEGTRTVTSALDSLFRSLKLPQRYALGFDDVEALGRKSRERHQELIKLKILLRTTPDTETQAVYDKLRAEMDRDEKFLLRMQLIVLAYLSHSQRGDEVPVFCSHVIQLGRQQDNEKVKVAAIKSLGLQCLVSPDAVHTFMPLLLADGREHAASSEEAVPQAAIGVVFDLVMEYGLKFFGTESRHAAHVYNEENSLEARLLHEQELAEEDVHKVGSQYLLSTLVNYLNPCDVACVPLAVVGFCKLLSCNRVPDDRVPLVLAMLSLHLVQAQMTRKEASLQAYLYDFLSRFFRSFAASHPRRQSYCAVGGVAAFRVLLANRQMIWAHKVMEHTARTTDAFTLTQIRDIDPEVARRVSREAELQRESGQGGGGADEADTSNAAGAKLVGGQAVSMASRVTATRSSMQSGRLLRELSRCSLHETLAQELLLEMVENVAGRSVCMEILEQHMYFYSKETQPFLFFCLRRAIESVQRDQNSAGLLDRLQAWSAEAATRFGAADVTGGTASDKDDPDGLEGRWAEGLRRRGEMMSALQAAGFDEMGSGSPGHVTHRTPAPPPVKKERGSAITVKREREGDVFDVESILRSRARPR